MKIPDSIKAYYSTPNYEKSGARLLVEMFLLLGFGILLGWGGARFIEDLNPLWLLLMMPGAISLFLSMARMKKIKKESHERNEAFKKEHDGLDMVTYCERELEKMEEQKNGNERHNDS